MDRRAILGIVTVVAVVAAVAGWAAGQRIKSPAEIAAGQQPPAPSLITVPIEQRVLSQNVVVRGTVRAGDAVDISVAAGEGTDVVTGLGVEVGAEVGEGDVVVEVGARPVIVLGGELPAFRALAPTLTGADVEQLEEALVRLGYDPGEADETYTSATAAAVEKLYRDRGYDPVGSGEDDQAALRSAREAVSGTEQGVRDAEQALADAKSGLKESERLSLDQAVEGARAGLAAANAEAKRSNEEAAASVKNARSRLEQARSGTHPDTGEPPTADETKELERELKAAEESAAAIASEQKRAVAAAETEVAVQEALRREALAPPDTASLDRQVATAREALQVARSELEQIRSRVGARIPVGEVVFVPEFPRQVLQVAVEVGDIPSGTVLSLSGTERIVDSGVSAADRSLIEVGAEAVISDDDLGIEAAATVTFVADRPGGGELADDRYAVRLRPAEALPAEALNLNLRVSIPISTSGAEVLAVPFAALSAGPDGAARVEVERSNGGTELVEVVTGLRAQGLVEIDPKSADLAAGDRVVVGREVELPADVEPLPEPVDRAENEDGDAAPGPGSAT